jgi:hypothetical protein
MLRGAIRTDAGSGICAGRCGSTRACARAQVPATMAMAMAKQVALPQRVQIPVIFSTHATYSACRHGL